MHELRIFNHHNIAGAVLPREYAENKLVAMKKGESWTYHVHHEGSLSLKTAEELMRTRGIIGSSWQVVGVRSCGLSDSEQNGHLVRIKYVMPKA